MSTIKVDTIATRTGSGNITASNTIAGTSATLSGTLGVTGNATVGGTLGVTGLSTFSSDITVTESNANASTDITILNANGVATVGNQAKLHLGTTNSTSHGASIIGEFTGTANTNHATDLIFKTTTTGSTLTEVARIDASGRVMIGTTTEGSGGADELTVGSTSGSNGITIRAATSGTSSIYMSDATSGAGEYAGYIAYSHGSDSMALAAAGGQRIRIDADGLKFGSDTAAANALNDYEEGTFTPTLLDSGDDLNPNYTFQAGQYTKVGNKVTFALRINSNSHDSDGDQLYVAGLPFAVNFTNTSNRSYVPVDGSGLNLDAGSGYYKLVGQLTNTNQSITLLQQGDLVVQNNFRANDLSQTKEIYISGTYFTNS